LATPIHTGKKTSKGKQLLILTRKKIIKNYKPSHASFDLNTKGEKPKTKVR
jgi:hypothetical protein